MHRHFPIVTLLLTVLSPVLADDGLVAQWRFEPSALTDGQFSEAVGDAHAVLEGPTAFGGTGLEKAALVSLNDTKLSVPKESGASARPTDALTVSAWLCIERTVEWADIIGAAQRTGGLQKGWTLGFRQSNFSFGLSTAGADDGDGNMTYARSLHSLEWGRWYHVVGTYDGETQRLFVNGELAAEEKTQSGAILYPDEAPIVFAGGSDGGWRGWLYESSIHNRALSSDEVVLAYEAKSGQFPDLLHVKVGPFLQRINKDQVRIAWETDAPSSSTLLWGDTLPLAVAQSSDEKRKQHTVFVDGLEPESRYWYRVAFEDDAGETQYSRLHEFDSTFDYTPVRVTAKPYPYESDAERDRFSSLAEDILSDTGVSSGYALVVGAGKGRLAYELAWQSDLQIICIDDDAKRVQAIRRTLDATGLYGVKVSVIQADLGDLPTTQYFANLVVSENLLEGKTPGSIDEINRVTRPDGGRIWLQWDGEHDGAVRTWLNTADSGWSVSETRATFSRPEVPGAGEWTHQYGQANNTANSEDEVIGGAMEALWYGEPGPRPMVDRGTRSPAPLSANARLYVQGDRRLFGIDAFNGTIYWDLEVPDLRRANMPRDGSNMVVNEDTLYATVRDRCWVLEGQTGALKATFTLPEGFKENYDWGYLASEGDTLYGSAVKRGGLFVGADGEWYDKRGDESQKVISDILFAMNRHTGELLWTREGGAVVNSTITLGGDRLFFIESRGETVKALDAGRAGNELAEERFLVSMDAEGGGALWDRPYAQSEGTFVMYLMYTEDRLVAVNSSDRWDLFAYGTSDGEFLWEQHYEWLRDHHGGAMTHPAIVGDMIVAEPKIVSLSSGKVLRDVPDREHGCGTLAASAKTVLWRDGNHGMWNLETDERTVWNDFRPGCWLGMISANGLLLAPETSAGCWCASQPLQTSVAFAKADAAR
jgi:SAM-dependent methyltransferase